jgi:two-component system, cell cycle response regulator
MLWRAPMVDFDDDPTLTKTLVDLSGQQARLIASVMVLTGPSIGKVFRLTKPSTTIGRVADADIHLETDSVSRRHATLEVGPEGIDLVDLGSKNGTLLNGKRVTGRNRLANGDRVQVGDTVLKFTFLDRLDEEVQRVLYDSAIRDGLTGAYNRKFLNESLERDFAFCLRHDLHLSVLMMDVDHFKRLNDEHGHPTGDRALRALAEAIHRAIRTEDVFARYGGEEFTLVMREVTSEVAVAIAERLRKMIAGLHVSSDTGADVQMTISVGVATHEGDRFDNVGALEAEADRNLLRAKREGRNCVRASDGPKPAEKTRKNRPAR